MEYQLTEIEQLRIIYQEIISGYSQSLKGYYIKHLNEIEQIGVLRKRVELYNKYLADGVPSAADKLKALMEQEQWSQSQEDRILELKYIISDNEKNLPNVIQQMQGIIRNVIDQKRKELHDLLLEKHQLLGLTADHASEQDTYHYLVYISLFKDDSCQNPLFSSFDDFENLEEEDIASYVKEVEVYLSKFSELHIRKISVMPFFVNSFSYSKEAVHTFVNKPISQLTNYQMLLFSMGSRNINIVSQAEGEPPELMDDVGPQKILDWYDQQFSLILTKRNSK